MTKANWQLCRIGRQYSFSAAHWLPNVADGHKCKNLHGHNYVVELEVRNEIAPKDGFCGNVDFATLDEAMAPILKQLDHKCLNDVMENPTAELIAAWILEQFAPKILFSVKVWETPKCWAQVVADGGYFQKAHRE